MIVFFYDNSPSFVCYIISLDSPVTPMDVALDRHEGPEVVSVTAQAVEGSESIL